MQKDVTRILACSGKLYYDLLTARRERRLDNVAIIRVEQLYPFPHKQFAAEMKRDPNAKEVVWCQEEPENQGAWFKVSQDFAALGLPCRYVGRKAYASPAVGYASVFKEEQDALVSEALA